MNDLLTCVGIILSAFCNWIYLITVYLIENPIIGIMVGLYISYKMYDLITDLLIQIRASLYYHKRTGIWRWK